MLDRSAESTRAKASHVWARNDHDWYVEPEWATRALLFSERFVGSIWDPACGAGNIVRECLVAGYQAYGSDIVDRCHGDYWFLLEQNFLDKDIMIGGENIVTNPPFFRAKGTEAFIRKALSVATGKVAVFADVKFLASSSRGNGLFAEHCPHRVWIHAKRPSCPPGEYLAAGNKAGGGTADWMWMVWDRTAPPVTVYQGGWLR